ncbi:poly(A) RNA polymerase, mitochondrial [Drosophila rhopaloa]|uniref:Poly(A) RNA polymerase, mitochondrial n=1 Tax=Drosophila rhopaloa TaxID=1041015 RepID=A0A6P4EFB8_DRORH|nr:poly(A) RNA polymerase, mitochondrial [Drosophila rhopaloa]
MNSLVRRTQQLSLWRTYCVKHNAPEAASATRNTGKSNYGEFIGHHQRQARRSIVVQVSSEKSYAELYNYCSRFGSILAAHHYCVRQEEALHYVLLEYATPGEAEAAIGAGVTNGELTGVPVRSPFLWFRAAAAGGGRRSPKLTPSPMPHLVSLDGTRQVEQAHLLELMRSARDIEEQVQLLHEHTRLNELGIRIRFLAALQVQLAIAGMFPAAQAHPFGSSVNGFGRMGCDLDLILRFDNDMGAKSPLEASEPSRLVFHTKENLSNGRSQTQRHMECFGDMLHLFLPGVCHVRRILQARVPIIKYHHEHLDLEVDLSMSNLTGFYMSELLYMFGEMDPRVRPLTFSIRRWAQSCGLTNPSPGRWISNFSLTCLVMFFLQQLRQPILPTIGALAKSAEPGDSRVTEDGISCSFARNVERLGFRSRNQSSMSELLLQFFEFYSQFDFHNRAISLNEGRGLSKPDHSAMYIVNPLEQLLNVSKNVSLEECERLRIEVRNAAWVLESEVENASLPDGEGERRELSWGVLNLFKHPERAVIRPNMFFKPRMVEVSDLFEQKEAGSMSSPNPPTPAITYNNASVRQQVQSIKEATRSELKQLRGSASSVSTNSPKNRRSNR